MTRVFIINDSGHDFSDAARFGTLTVMTTGEIDRFNVMKMKRIFERHLLKSSPDDFILHTGPGVMSAVACACFAGRHQRLNLLLWRAEYDGNDRYVHRKLIFKLYPTHEISEEQDDS
jgi:hypothetical protein